MNELSPRIIEILLVEDNPGDVRLTREILQDGRIRNRLSTVVDGVEALACLRRSDGYEAFPRPDLVLLDLNLPRKGGIEVLREIKDDSALRRIPVIVLTSSRSEQDILRSYDLHANSYIAKPVEVDQFIDVVRTIEHFWLQIVTLPNSHAGEH